MEYETLVAPGAALLVGVVAALATMLVNRERHSQKIERLANAIKNLENFPKQQEGLAKEITRTRLRMGYNFQYPVLVFVVQAMTIYLFVALALLFTAIIEGMPVLILGSVVAIAIYVLTAYIDNRFYRDYVDNFA